MRSARCIRHRRLADDAAAGAERRQKRTPPPKRPRQSPRSRRATCLGQPKPAPPPRPEPPRLPAWLQPPARPFSSGEVACAIRLSAASALKADAVLNANTRTSISTMFPERAGMKRSPSSAARSSMAEITNQTLFVSVVSTSGPRRNFQVCGTGHSRQRRQIVHPDMGLREQVDRA